MFIREIEKKRYLAYMYRDYWFRSQNTLIEINHWWNLFS